MRLHHHFSALQPLFEPAREPDARTKGPKLLALLASFTDAFLLRETDALFLRR